jgi:HK97 family phage portal protein
MADTDRALAVLRETIPVKEKAADAVQSTSAFPRLFTDLANMWVRGQDAPDPLGLQDAMQLSAVLICLDVISQDIAKTELNLYERLAGGGKRKVEPGRHPMAALLARRPNKHHTWFEFLQMVVLHLGLTQNAFLAKEIKPDGTVLTLTPCVPWRTRILVSADYASYLYEIGKDTVLEKILYRQFPEKVLIEDEMIHVRMRMMDGLVGYSNMLAGSKTMRLAQELIDFQTRMYRNDGTLRGVFEQKQGAVEPLSTEALDNLRSQLGQELYALKRHGHPLILEDGLSFKQISQTADQAEVSKARDAMVVDVARAFRIPPHKIFHLINVKYENMETLESSYAFDTLIPIAKALEERLKVGLLDEKDQERFFFEFDREAMTITDVEKQSEMIKVMMAAGAMTWDEARARRGLNPLPNGAGKARTIPTTYMVVDEKNEIIVAAAGVDPEFAREMADKQAEAAKANAEAAAENADQAGDENDDEADDTADESGTKKVVPLRA